MNRMEMADILRTNVRKFTITSCLLFLALSAIGQDSLWQRNYQINGFNQRDLRNPSYLGITTHQVLHDAFRKKVKPLMSEKSGSISYGVFSFATTYMTLIWSHELGHALRAKQVGGEFRIHNGNLPIPYTTMHLPSDISYPNEALSVTAGFEVNYLTARTIQRQYIENNGTYNEDLGYAFANNLMFPIYTLLIVPLDPEDKDVWINTAGDPVHCILPVFKNYSDNKVFMSDSSVNPDLVKLYNQAFYLGNFFRLLDPQFYMEAGGAFGNNKKTRRPIFLIGDHHNGWTYGTLFNLSSLGYELYLNNYVHIQNRQFSIYVKYGNPFKNNGLGIRWGNMLDNDRLKMAISIEGWDQDIYGSGLASELESAIHISPKLGLNVFMGYKTEGYVLGKQIGQGVNLGFGVTYRASY